MATKPVDAPEEPQANSGRMSCGQLSPDRTQQDSANKAQQKAERKLTDQVSEPLLSAKVNPPDHLQFQSQKNYSKDELPQPLKQSAPASSIILDVGGKKFRTTRGTLMKLPNTRLGRLVQEQGQLSKSSGMEEFFFDRNPEIMNSVLDLYRKGELHLPSNICYTLVEEELEFWEIPTELIGGCCWRHFQHDQKMRKVMAEMCKFLQVSFSEVVVKGTTSFRLKLWSMLEFSHDSPAPKIWGFIFFVSVFLSIFNFIFETDPYFRVPTDTFSEYLDAHNTTVTQAYDELPPVRFMAVTLPITGLHTLRFITTAFFSLDFMLRLVTCPVKKKFFKQPRNWLEMVIFAKTILHFVMELVVFAKETEEVSHEEKMVTMLLYALSGVRILRILYLATVFPDLKVVILTFKSSLKDLLLMVTGVFIFVLGFATMAYISEVFYDLRTFHSIFDAMWWAIITMTTVGYGDVHPTRWVGKMVGSVCALFGVLVLAMPIAIIAENFSIYHMNLRPCTHNMDRISFLKKNPQFSIFQSSESLEHISQSSESLGDNIEPHQHHEPVGSSHTHDAGQHFDLDKNDDIENPNMRDTIVSDWTANQKGKKGQSEIKSNRVFVSSVSGL